MSYEVVVVVVRVGEPRARFRHVLSILSLSSGGAIHR